MSQFSSISKESKGETSHNIFLSFIAPCDFAKKLQNSYLPTLIPVLFQVNYQLETPLLPKHLQTKLCNKNLNYSV